MDDLISRQAAIDEIDAHIKSLSTRGVSYEGHYYIDGLESAKLIIEDLPSTQPEQQWIPCKERQPEEDGAYLVTLTYIDNKGTEHRYTSIQEFKCGMWIMFGSCRIEAWMPLPEPYREDNR